MVASKKRFQKRSRSKRKTTNSKGKSLWFRSPKLKSKRPKAKRSRSISSKKRQVKKTKKVIPRKGRRKAYSKRKTNTNKTWTEAVRKSKRQLMVAKAKQIKTLKGQLKLLQGGERFLSLSGKQTLKEQRQKIQKFQDELRHMDQEYKANTSLPSFPSPPQSTPPPPSSTTPLPPPLPSFPSPPQSTPSPPSSTTPLFLSSTLSRPAAGAGSRRPSQLYTMHEPKAIHDLPNTRDVVGIYNPPVPPLKGGISQPLDPLLPLWPYFQSSDDATQLVAGNHGVLLSKDESRLVKTLRSSRVIQADILMWTALNGKRHEIFHTDTPNNSFRVFFLFVCEELKRWKSFKNGERMIGSWIIFVKSIARFMNVFACNVIPDKGEWTHKCNKDHVLKVTNSTLLGMNKYTLPPLAEAIGFVYAWQFLGPRSEKYIEFQTFNFSETLEDYFKRGYPNGKRGYKGMPIPTLLTLPRFSHVNIVRQVASSKGERPGTFFYAECNSLERMVELSYSSGGGDGGGGMTRPEDELFLPSVPTDVPSATSVRREAVPVPTT